MSEKPFKLAVKALVSDDQARCLLIKRSASSKLFGGKWDLPGGKVDPGEAFDAALFREAAEETGLTVALTGVAGAAELELPAIRVATLFMEARVVSGDVRLSHEHDAFLWASRDEMAGMDFAEQVRPVVDSYLQRDGA